MSKTGSTISIFSYPKINLALDILGRDKSGYHEIQTVFHQLKEPVDEIILENREDGFLEIECDNPKVPLDSTNTVLKAAQLLKKYIEAQKKASQSSALGAKIFIKKRIPLMSGLGGGSSNAVAALKGLAKLWNINYCSVSFLHKQGSILRPFGKLTTGGALDDKNCILRKTANQIGMDCQFFFDGGTALGSHFGEKITPLLPLPPEIKFKIIETGVEISSHWAYDQINLMHCGKNIEKTKALIAAIQNGDASTILKNLHNDFEEFIFEKYPALRKKKRETKLGKNSRILLCGSGGALFHVNAAKKELR